MSRAVEQILGRIGMERGEISRFTCHPGGAKVVVALERSLHLDEGTLDHERAVLRDYGNMSAPTVLFVLERLIQAGMPERTLLLALGPGFTTSGLSLMSNPASARPERNRGASAQIHHMRPSTSLGTSEVG
jgi:alkylresorcinol/alkylpyrone synthase